MSKTQTEMVLKVVTPQGSVLTEGHISFVRLQSVNGEIGVMPMHTPAIIQLAPGEVQTQSLYGEKVSYFIPGGIVEIDMDRVMVIAPYLEKAVDIDHGRAESALKRAQERLNSKQKSIDWNRAEKALLRAEARLYISLKHKAL
ncbi:MAG: ATP synthase F1 subunit epsilon [Candidatus Margulisiibacteriota bacterium]